MSSPVDFWDIEIGFIFSNKAIRILFVSDLAFRASNFRPEAGELALNWVCFFAPKIGAYFHNPFLKRSLRHLEIWHNGFVFSNYAHPNPRAVIRLFVIPHPFVYAQGRPDAESSTSAILDSRFRGNDKEENQSPYNTMHAGSLVEGLKVNNPESEMCRARIK